MNILKQVVFNPFITEQLESRIVTKRNKIET